MALDEIMYKINGCAMNLQFKKVCNLQYNPVNLKILKS
jgi:hypothetical protein